mgnify:CR=1 FL=1
MSIARLFQHRTVTHDLYRPAAMDASGLRGDATLLQAGLVTKRWPATNAPNVIAAIPGLATARVAYVIATRLPADVQPGDELRDGSRIFKVEGVGVWQTVLIAGCSEVLTP